jgi:hypothetical protein
MIGRTAMVARYRFYRNQAATGSSCRRRRDAPLGSNSNRLGVGPVDLRIVEAGLDDGCPGVVLHDEFGNAADRLEGAHVGVGQRNLYGELPKFCFARSRSAAMSALSRSRSCW